MQRTAISTLVIIVVPAAALGAAVALRFFNTIPPLTYLTAVTLVAVAIGCGATGWSVRGAIRDNRVGQDRSQLNPLTVVRVLALAKAVSLLGAGVLGLFGGYAAVLGVRRDLLVAAATDFPVAVAIAVSALVLLIVGVVVERWCEVPPGGDEELGGTPEGSAA